MDTYLYGLNHTNKIFTEASSFGKNTFTTAFPVALANYISCEKGLDMNYIKAFVSNAGVPYTDQVLVPLQNIIGVSLEKAFYAFEDSYAGYDVFATSEANRSDLVIKDRTDDSEVSAFEVKLVAVPTSDTARCSREDQCCELVVRPPSIEQLCFSVASSYGAANRQLIGDIIVKALGNPSDYDWSNESYMLLHRHQILEAANEIIRCGINKQKPLILMAIWRTNGQDPELDEECFDVFFWSNLAFLQLFTNVMENAIEKNAKRIGRPDRALIWFIKSMFDYASQGTVTFERTLSLITYDKQTDKAGSFTTNNIRPFVRSDNFIHPRVSASERKKIIDPLGAAMLKPERRLDAVLISLGMRDLLESLELP